MMGRVGRARLPRILARLDQRACDRDGSYVNPKDRVN